MNEEEREDVPLLRGGGGSNAGAPGQVDFRNPWATGAGAPARGDNARTNSVESLYSNGPSLASEPPSYQAIGESFFFAECCKLLTMF